VTCPAIMLLGVPLIVGVVWRLSFGGFVAAGVGGAAVAWLYWALALPRWRLWAYKRVDDLGELRRAAVTAALAPPVESPRGQGQLMTQRQRQEELVLLRQYRKRNGSLPAVQWPVETPEAQARTGLALLAPGAAATIWLGTQDPASRSTAIVTLLAGIICILVPVAHRLGGIRLSFPWRAISYFCVVVGVADLWITNYSVLGLGGWILAALFLLTSMVRGMLRGSRA